MTEIATTVPSTWKESRESEQESVRLNGMKNDAERQQVELLESIECHKQYHEAVMRTEKTLKEIENKLEEGFKDTELQNATLFEVTCSHAPVGDKSNVDIFYVHL